MEVRCPCVRAGGQARKDICFCLRVPDFSIVNTILGMLSRTMSPWVRDAPRRGADVRRAALLTDGRVFPEARHTAAGPSRVPEDQGCCAPPSVSGKGRSNRGAAPQTLSPWGPGGPVLRIPLAARNLHACTPASAPPVPRPARGSSDAQKARAVRSAGPPWKPFPVLVRRAPHAVQGR